MESFETFLPRLMLSPPTDQQLQRLRDALVSTFNLNDLRRLIKPHFDTELEQIVPVQDRTLR